MLKSKKGFSFMMVISLLITIITLIVIFVYINDQFNHYKYQQSILDCNLFFKSVEGKPIYFTNSLDKPTEKLIEGISTFCPSKNVPITKNSISKAAELVNDCWSKTAKGVDIFGAQSKNLRICVYCGRITSKDSINNFNELFNNEINKSNYKNLFATDTKTKNLNTLTLSHKWSIPKNIGPKNSITVFYYTYKPEYPKAEDITPLTYFKDTIMTPFSRWFGSLGSVAAMANFRFSSSVIETYSGIILTNEKTTDKTNFKNTQNTINFKDCQVIIPYKNFN